MCPAGFVWSEWLNTPADVAQAGDVEMLSRLKQLNPGEMCI